MPKYEYETKKLLGIIFSCIQKDIAQLAEKMARKYYCEQLQEDLESVAAIAFMRHVGDFEPAIIPRLFTYLYPFLKAAMRREIERNMGPFSISKREFRKRSEEKTLALLTKLSFDSSFDDYVRNTKASLSQAICDPSVEQGVYINICTENLRNAFDMLSFKERELIGAFHGVFGHKKRTLADLGEEFCMSEESARKAKDKALEKLRKISMQGDLGYWMSIRSAIRETQQDATIQSKYIMHRPQPCHREEVLAEQIRLCIVRMKQGRLREKDATEQMRLLAIDAIAKQIAEGYPKCTQAVLEQLMQTGAELQTALDMMAAVLLQEVYYVLKYKHGFDERRYARNLGQLLENSELAFVADTNILSYPRS